MKKKQEFIGTVERVEFPNKGYVTVEGEEGYVIVKNVIAGQIIKGVATKKRKGNYLGRLLEISETSKDEISAPCPVFGECGGCLYQSLPYEKQLSLKERQVKKMLSMVIEDLDDHYEGILASPEVFGYRNKMEYSFGDNVKDGPLMLGMHKRGSTYDITDAGHCQIVDEAFNQILRHTLDTFTKEQRPYYHKKSHEGYLRYLIIRQGAHTNEIMVNLVTSTQKPWSDMSLEPWLEGLKAIELEGRNQLVSVVHTESDNLSDAIKPERVIVLHGRDYLNETLLNLKFKVSPFSFFQTNSKGAEVLYDVVREYVGDTKDQVVFDLYSGTGTIAQLVAPVAKKAVGVEIIEEAVEAAKENAVYNGLDNCEFIAGDVLGVLDDLEDKPDIIILDPPRNGIHPKALPKIIDYGVENIVYVSCKPTSLARDLEVFMDAGYRVERVKLVDMFPHTYHVETCLLLKRSL